MRITVTTIFRFIAFLGCLIGVGQSVSAQEYANTLFSVAHVTEEDSAGEELDGVKLGLVLYYDDHAPPMTGFVSLEHLSGATQELTRLAGSFSIFEFPGGKPYSIWLRPVAGLEYRDSESDGSFDGFLGIGAELILRPHWRVQVGLTYDRIYSFSGDESDQVGIALRYGF